MTDWTPSEDLVAQALSHLQVHKPAMTYGEASDWLAVIPELVGGARGFEDRDAWRAFVGEDRLFLEAARILAHDPTWTPSRALEDRHTLAEIGLLHSDPEADSPFPPSNGSFFGDHRSGQIGSDGSELYQITSALFTALQSAFAQLSVVFRDVDDVLDSRVQEAGAARIVQYGSSLAACLAENRRTFEQDSPGFVTVSRDVLVHAVALFSPGGVAWEVFEKNLAEREDLTRVYDLLPTYGLLSTTTEEVIDLAVEQGVLQRRPEPLDLTDDDEFSPFAHDPSFAPLQFSFDVDYPLPDSASTAYAQQLLLEQTFDVI